jgi:hypothetical protein
MKEYAKIALIAIAAMAIVSRIPKIKSVIFG